MEEPDMKQVLWPIHHLISPSGSSLTTRLMGLRFLRNDLAYHTADHSHDTTTNRLGGVAAAPGSGSRTARIATC